MKRFLLQVTTIYPAKKTTNLSLLTFRTVISLQLMVAHGLKKIGVGVPEAEVIPNPLHLPVSMNQFLAISANLFFPILIILGLFTRLAVLPVLVVTLVGYFIVHWNDTLLEKDIPFMYSVAYLFILFVGPGKYSIDNLISEKLKKY